MATKAEIIKAANDLADDIIGRAHDVLRQKPELTREQAIMIVIELMALDIDERTVA
jgi:hypothetical protein